MRFTDCYSIVEADRCIGIYAKGVCSSSLSNHTVNNMLLGNQSVNDASLANALINNITSLAERMTTQTSGHAHTIKHSATSFTSSSEEYFLLAEPYFRVSR